MNRKRPYSQDNVAVFKRHQLELDKSATAFELRARRRPFLCADEAWFTTQGVLRHLREKGIRQYGADVERYGLLILSSALEPTEDGNAPRNGTLGTCTVAVFFVHLYMAYATNFAAMKAAYQRPDIWGVNVAYCVCELYATLMREQLREAFVALETIQKKFSEAARREALAEMLAGYFESQLSTSAQYPLGRALSDERQALSDVLPAEALAVWADRGQDELKVLRNRISKRLQQLGRESSFKDKVIEWPRKRSELSDEEAEIVEFGEEEKLLQEFLFRETLRQEVQRLRGWAEAAGFSTREAQMYELDMRTNYNTAAAAREMGVPDKKARDYRSRYLAKLKRAAGH